MPTELVPLPLKGIDDNDPLTIQPDHAVDLRNVRLRQGAFDRRWGHAQLGQFTGVDFRRFMTAAFTTARTTGFDAFTIAQLLGFAPNHLYVFDGVNWQNVPIDGQVFGVVPDYERMSAVNTLNYVVWTSRLTPMCQYNGEIAGVLDHDLSVTDFSALAVIAVNNRVVAIRTKEDDNEYPSRIRWCANGQITKWEPGNTDGAGFLEVRETSNAPLTGGFVLGNRGFLTKDREILELVATGQPEPAFKVESRVSGTGMIAPHSFAGADFFGFFMGPDNIYMFDGSSIKPVGEPIRHRLYKDLGIPSAGAFSFLNWIQGTYHSRDNEYHLILPSHDEVFIYDYKEDRWFTDTLSIFKATGSEMNFRFGSIFGLRPADLGYGIDQDDTMLYSLSTGVTTRLKRSSADDEVNADGTTTPVAIRLETRDFLAQEFSPQGPRPTFSRLNVLQNAKFKAPPKSKSLVSVSADQGTSWTKVEAVADDRGVATAWFNVPYNTIRFRIECDNAEGWSVTPMLTYLWKPAGVFSRA